MARSIYIPGLLRIVTVKTSDEIAAANDTAGVDRPLSGRGGLVNRMIARRLAALIGAHGGPWPAFASRLDPLRASGQRNLERRLTQDEELLASIADEIAELAAFVRTGRSARQVGVLVQQAVGRLFFPDYAATEESYKAAVVVSSWLSAGPLKSLYLRCSGRFRAALDQLGGLARDDVHCAHATALALHNIVDSVETMRKLARSGALKELSPAEIATRTLRAPPRIIREARDSGTIGNRHHGPRALVIMAVESARKRDPDSGAFFATHWNQCPAHAFVPRLLAEIWRIARMSQ